MTVRTRFEPSPSGTLHVGSAMTASFNWLFARRHGGRFILRIADTDVTRVTEEGLRSALEDLRWLGLAWDEGPEVGGPHEPYFQSERVELYRDAARRIVEAGNAYRCYCTPEELKARREQALAEHRTPGYDGRCRTLTDAQVREFQEEGREPAIRFRVPEGETVVEDLVHGTLWFDHAQIRDFVILRANGTPLYLLSAAVDDIEMAVTHVIRGEDILASTSEQIMIMRALGAASIPTYAHIPLIVGADRKPLGKRHKDAPLDQYRTTGYLPEAMLNYLVILNWSVGDGVTERFSVAELIEKFDLSGVTRNPSAFDPAKLSALNGEKIRALTADDLARRIEPPLVGAGILPASPTEAQRALVRRVTPLIQERIARLDETPSLVRFFFSDVEPDARATAILNGENASLLEAALGVLENVEPWTTEAIQTALQGWADGAGIKRKDAFQPLRAALTGALVSPPLFESIDVLGRERALARVHAGLARARAG